MYNIYIVYLCNRARRLPHYLRPLRAAVSLECLRIFHSWQIIESICHLNRAELPKNYCILGSVLAKCCHIIVCDNISAKSMTTYQADICDRNEYISKACRGIFRVFYAAKCHFLTWSLLILMGSSNTVHQTD